MPNLFTLESIYRTASAARNAAAVAFDLASTRADVAYSNRQDTFSKYLTLVQDLAVERGELPPVPGPSRPRAPSKRKRVDSFPGVAPTEPASGRKGKARASAIEITDDGEDDGDEDMDGLDP